MDGGVSRKIAALSVSEPGARVIEVGAGTGALTYALLAAEAKVTALEIDHDLIAILREREDLGAAEILEGDALTFDFDAHNAGNAWTAAGNLPYNVATPLILRFFELENPPDRIVAMIQKDVAERFVAKPGTPEFGSLSLFVQFHASVRRALTLGPQSFYPKPGVDSAVVVLERLATPPIDVRDRAFFLQVVRGAFAYRRKTLANSLQLALAIERERTQRALSSLGIDTEIRAEQLDLGIFGALADRLAG
jgi:16S rRNA (adenine1518-N6/adenine1519-N6)-dimethyltransferase